MSSSHIFLISTNINNYHHGYLCEINIFDKFIKLSLGNSVATFMNNYHLFIKFLNIIIFYLFLLPFVAIVLEINLEVNFR
jgi:hypothetical protein